MSLTELLSVPLATTFLIGLISILLLYRYSVRNHGYWKKRGVPTARTVPFIGSIIDGFTKSLHEIEMERFQQLGPIYGYFVGNTPSISVADPVLLRNILVKDFLLFHNRPDMDIGDNCFNYILPQLKGEDWKRVRNILTPTFTTGKIKRMLNIFKDCSKSLIENFKSTSDSGKPTNVKKMYGAFVMDVIASAAFSTKLDSHKDPENEFTKAASDVFTLKINLKFLLFMAFPRLMFLLGFSVFKQSSMMFFKNVILQIIEERKRTGQVRNDFLQLMMDSAKEVSQQQTWNIPEEESGDIASNYGDQGQVIFRNVASKHLSTDEMIAQSVVFFLAGYDTTATILALATYHLAIQPEIQDKLRAEVDEAIKKTGGELTYDTIQSMKYLDNVISETLRLYPLAVRLERVSFSDYKLGDTGITIPKGMVVSVPVFAIHKDPTYFPEPEKFDPDRFTAEARAQRDQYTYLPFGVGPRNCIGMRFALMEIKSCLATVVATFNIKRCPQTQVPLEFNHSYLFLQPKDMLVDMEERTDSPLQQ